MKQQKIFGKRTGRSREASREDCRRPIFSSDEADAVYQESCLSNLFLPQFAGSEHAPGQQPEELLSSQAIVVDELAKKASPFVEKPKEKSLPETKRGGSRRRTKVAEDFRLSDLETQSKTKSKDTKVLSSLAHGKPVILSTGKQERTGLKVSIQGAERYHKGFLVKRCTRWRIIYAVLSLATLFLLNLVNYWLNDLIYIYTVFKPAQSIGEATGLILKHGKRASAFVPLKPQQIFLTFETNFEALAFELDGILYFWNSDAQAFQSLRTFVKNCIVKDFVFFGRKGRSEEEAKLALPVFGPNQMLVGYVQLFRSVRNFVLSPMCLFQLLFLAIIFIEGHQLYAGLMAAFIVLRGVNVLKRSIEVKSVLKDIATQTDAITVVRRQWDGNMRKRLINFSDVVPGDLVELTNGLTVEADLLMIQGACVVKYSKEPAQAHDSRIKKALDSYEQFNRKQHIIEAGYKISYTLTNENDPCLALVIQTNFYTQRMKSFRKALGQDCVDAPNRKDVHSIFKWLTAFCSVTCFAFLLFTRLFRGAMAVDQLVSFMVHIGIVCLKPSLFISVIVSYYFSEKRLASRGVWTRLLSKISKARRITHLVSEISVYQKPVFQAKGYLLSVQNEGQQAAFGKIISKPQVLYRKAHSCPHARKFVQAVSFCNGLIKLGNELIGSEKEKTVFKSSPYDIDYGYQKSQAPVKKYRSKLSTEKDLHAETFVLVKEFERTKANKMLSVIVRSEEADEYFLFTMGSSEDVIKACAAPTVPEDSRRALMKFNVKGCETLAYSYKKLDGSELGLKRELLEASMNFLGCFVVQEEYSDAHLKLSEELAEKEINHVVFSSKDFSKTVSLLRNKDLVPLDAPIVHVQLAGRSSQEQILWTKYRVEGARRKVVVEEKYTSKSDICPDFYSSELWADCLLVVDSAVVSALLADGKPQQKSFVLRSALAYCNLETRTRRLIIEQYRHHKATQGKTLYMFNRLKHGVVAESASVSYCLGQFSVFSNASFTSTRDNPSAVSKIIREGATAYKNSQRNLKLLIVFIAAQFCGLVILYAIKTSFTISQILFMDIFVLLGLSCLQSMVICEKAKQKAATAKTLLDRKEAIVLGGELAIAVGLLLTTMLVLWHVRFYQKPEDFVDEGLPYFSPEGHFFYEPFLIFWVVTCYSIIFTLKANKGVIFNDSYKQKKYLFIYLILLSLASLVLLFVRRLPALGGVTKKTFKMFRIPLLMGGFDTIMFFKVFFDAAIIFIAALWLKESVNAHFARKRARQGEQRSAEERPRLSLLEEVSEAQFNVDEELKSKIAI